MAEKRSDAWDDEKDKLLLETTLKHIRTGSTQLKAFEEVAVELGKTSAACGFRWNSHIRKLNKEAVELAKKEGKKRNKKQEEEVPAPVSEQPAEEAANPTQPTRPSRKLSVIVNIKSHTEQLLDLVGELQTELSNEKNTNEDLETKYTELKEKYDEMVSVMSKFTK